ncbi:CPBP family intramembrane glutamic endopeptidase [Companilactobacillus hulinensis]|uniref:CPBP family intramembrane glutamic endopeptidase n=1 Tax=Companilactobacillus hulinensis TaxID=2486007 RepID=UPI000F769B9A|nr:CPBP family intramembrane glutamic endopeptidase [Companilactobacillus hulinensis]
MTSKKRDILSLIGLIFYIPAVILICDFSVSRWVPREFAQLVDDVLIFGIAYFLNSRYLKLDIHFFNIKHIPSQILNSIPGIIMLLLFKHFNNVGVTKNFVVLLITVIMVGVAEEFTYRGLMLPLVERIFKGKLFLAVLISSIGFGLTHLVNLFNEPLHVAVFQILLAIASGMLYGGIYVTTHNLTIPIILHVLGDVPVMLSKTPSTDSNSLVKMGSSDIMGLTLFLCGLVAITCLVAFIQLHIYKKRHKNNQFV